MTGGILQRQAKTTASIKIQGADQGNIS